jgi:hypothetical protein
VHGLQLQWARPAIQVCAGSHTLLLRSMYHGL